MDWSIWPVRLQMDDNAPLYRQLESVLLGHIAQKRLMPGDGLPSEGELCEHYGISRSTVRQAFKQLEQQGLVLRRRGLGTFVAEPKVPRSIDHLYSFTHQLSTMGYETASQVLRFEDTVLDKKAAHAMELPKGLAVYVIERLRLAGGVPMLLETTTIVKSFCPPLTASGIERHSLYTMLKEHGLVMGRAVESYEPIVMNKKTQKLLRCDANACAFCICRKSYTSGGDVFEWTQSVMPGQRSRLEITLHEDSMRLHRFEEKA